MVISLRSISWYHVGGPARHDRVPLWPFSRRPSTHPRSPTWALQSKPSETTADSRVPQRDAIDDLAADHLTQHLKQSLLTEDQEPLITNTFVQPRARRDTHNPITCNSKGEWYQRLIVMTFPLSLSPSRAQSAPSPDSLHTYPIKQTCHSLFQGRIYCYVHS